MQAYSKELSELFAGIENARKMLMNSLLAAQRMENQLSEVQFSQFRGQLKQLAENVEDFQRMYQRSKE